MKKLTLLLTVSLFSFSFSANSAPPTHSHGPRVYIMWVKGKLIEVNNGRKKFIKKDVMLVNQTTIHPNGVVDAGSGEQYQLKEGQYITMDGRVRYLKDMAR